MGILDIGAGAGAGFEQLLERDREQELMQLRLRQQAESERSNRADETFRTQGLQQQRQLAGEVAAQREHAAQLAEQGRVRDDMRAVVGQLPMGSIVPESERTAFVQTGAAAPSRFSTLDMMDPKIKPGTVQSDPQAISMGVPSSLAQNEPQYELQGTPMEIAARNREKQFEDNQARLSEEARVRDEQMNRRLDIAETNAQRAQRGFAPRVVTTADGLMLFDPNTGTFTSTGQGQAPTAATRDRLAAAQRVQPVMTAISDLSEIINTKHGPLAKMEGGIRRLEALANMDDDVAEYMAIIKMFTPMVARAVGHVGVLTQQDVESVYSGFPMPGDSKSLRDRKIARISSLMTQISAAGNGTESAVPPGLSTTTKRTRYDSQGNPLP